MDDVKGIFARNLASLRTAAGMTQLDLGRELNYSDKAVSKWERAESLPDVTVLLSIAHLFGVTLDDLVRDSVSPPSPGDENRRVVRNRSFITGMCLILVWLLATAVYVGIELAPIQGGPVYLTFIYAVPASMVVWLVFNSLWFNRKRNYLIISLLMWSSLLAVFVTTLPFGRPFYLLFLLGIPGQIILLLWSRLNFKKE